MGSLAPDNTAELNAFSVGAGPMVFTLSFEFVETTDPFASNPRNNLFALRTHAGTGFANQLQQVDFRNFSGNPGVTFLIDDFAIFDGAFGGGAIPEPTTYALLFGGVALGVALLLRRRVRSRRQGFHQHQVRGKISTSTPAL